MLSRVTKIPRDSWRNIFRFMPTLMGILMGIQLTKDILNLPDFVQRGLSYHYHSVVIITVTFFCAHTASSFLKDKLSKSGDKAATTSILTTVVDLGVYMVGILFILSSYGISISPLLTALGAGGLASALAAWHRPWPCRIHWPTSFPALRRWYRNRSTWAITSACPVAKPAASSI